MLNDKEYDFNSGNNKKILHCSNKTECFISKIFIKSWRWYVLFKLFKLVIFKIRKWLKKKNSQTGDYIDRVPSKSLELS